METLRKNWAICAVWLVLLLALQYCGIPVRGWYIMFPPAILLAIILFTQHIAARVIFYIWMAFTAIMNMIAAVKYRELYSKALLLCHISISVICVILAASVAIWNYCQKHSKQ